MARIHIVGNSIAYGLSDDRDDWASRLKSTTNNRRIRGEKPNISIVNLASSGNMLIHFLDSRLFETSVDCNRRGRQLGVFCVGICETSILRSRGESTPRRTKADFAQDLNRLSTTIEGLNQHKSLESPVSALFMGITPVDNKASFCTPQGDYFNDELIIEYDSVVQEHTRQNGLPYVDLRTDFDPSAMLESDGIHPNKTGNTFIYDRVAPIIMGELAIKIGDRHIPS